MKKRRDFLKLYGLVLPFSVLSAPAFCANKILSSNLKKATDAYKKSHINTLHIFSVSSSHGGRFALQSLTRYTQKFKNQDFGNLNVLRPGDFADESILARLGPEDKLLLLAPESKEEFVWHCLFSYKTNLWTNPALEQALDFKPKSLYLKKEDFSRGAKKLQEYFDIIARLQAHGNPSQVNKVHFGPSVNTNIPENLESLLLQAGYNVTEGSIDQFIRSEELYDGIKLSHHPSHYFENASEIESWLKESKLLA